MINQNPLSKLIVGIPSFVIEDLNNTTMPGKSGGENNVAESLLQIAQNTSEECDSRTDEFLNVVCHKLSVHQIVRTSYDMQWRLAIQRTPLEVKWWPLMLFLLIRKCTLFCQRSKCRSAVFFRRAMGFLPIRTVEHHLFFEVFYWYRYNHA